MKKIFRLFFMMILTMSFGIVYAEDVTIDKVIEVFNTGEVVKSYVDASGNVVATYDEDSIDIAVTMDGQTYNLSYNLNDTVISSIIDESDENAFLKAYIFLGLIDEIGILHGYEAGELIATVNSEQISEYTLEQEGFESVVISESVQEIKIDYSKKIPLIDFSEIYVGVEDLEEYKEYIAGDGFAGTSKGDIYIYKSGNGGEYEILVGEKGQLTEASYKSILSMIEVMFDKKTVKYFKENYTNIEDKSFDGFEIKINYSDPDNSDAVNLEDNGYKLMLISVNKEDVLKAIENFEDIDNGADEENVEVTDESDVASIIKKENFIQTILKNYGLYIGIGAGVLVLLILIISIVGRKKKTVTSVANYETTNISMSDIGKVIRPAVFNNTEPIQSKNHSVQQPLQQQVQMNNEMQQNQMQNGNVGMSQQQMAMQQQIMMQQQMQMQQQSMAQQMNQGQQMNNMQNQNMNNYPNNYNGNNNYNGQ